MYRKIFSLIVIVCLSFLPSLILASTQSQALVTQGRLALFKNGSPTWQGILDANEKFKAAVAADDSDQTAHLFYAITNLGSFVLKTDDTAGIRTIADLVTAMGIPLHLDVLMDVDPPFGKPPELVGAYNPPSTVPNGDEMRSVLYPGFVGAIDLSLSSLGKINTILNVELTAQELDGTSAIEVDYTDVLLLKAFLSALKSVVLILSAYDLDGADLRELMVLSNSGMMELHPNMMNEFLTKYPDFLKLADNGATLLLDAKTSFQSAYTFLDQAYKALKQESGNQDNDLFVFESEGDSQEFQNVLNGLSEMMDSLTQNRPLTVQDVDSNWDIVTNLGDTLHLTLPETLFGNGLVLFDDTDFWGTIDDNNVQGWMPYWNRTGSTINITLISRGDFPVFPNRVLKSTLIPSSVRWDVLVAVNVPVVSSL